MRSAVVLATLPLIASVSAFWRLQCMGVVGVDRIDPLISPGEISGHVHTIKGSSSISVSASAEDLLHGQCTSCEVAQDHSAYWSPQMYFMGADGTVQAVPEIAGHLTYYKYVPVWIDGVYTWPEAIPFGFHMIAGDVFARNFSYAEPDPALPWTGVDASQDALKAKAIGFNCLNYAKKPEGSLYRHKMPSKDYLDENCVDGLRMELLFPQCWDGEDFEIADQSNHMWYPDAMLNGGNCPKGTKKNINQIFFETIYDVAAFKGQEGIFTFANGDPTGCSYHGDAIFAWEDGVLEAATQQCGPDNSAGMNGISAECPVFKMVNATDQASCKIENSKANPVGLLKSNVMTNLHALPGNNPLQYGPERATKPAGGEASSPKTTDKPDLAAASSVVASVPYSAGSSGGPYGNIMLQVTTTTSTITSTSTSTTSSIVTTTSSVAQAPASMITPAPAAPAPIPANVQVQNVNALVETTTYMDGQVLVDLAIVKEYVTVTVPAAPAASPAMAARAVEEHKRDLHRHQVGVKHRHHRRRGGLA